MTSRRLPIWPLALLFTLLWGAAAYTSEGFLEDDAWTHYFYSRFAHANPAYFFDVWGRPICTSLYALAAPWAGMMGCRVISLLLVMLCLVLTMRVAKLLRVNDHVAAAFLIGQPMIFLHSLTVMTELPFAVLLIAAFLAYIQRRWWIMAALVGLLPLARPEGFGFLLLGLAALAVHRRLAPMVLLAIPLIAWSWAGWFLWGAPPNRSAWWWLIDHWPYSASSTYGHGLILHFVIVFPVLVGAATPFILFALARKHPVGSALADRLPDRAISRSAKADPTNTLAEATVNSTADRNSHVNFWLLAAIPVAVLIAHSLLWFFGKMASYGEIRYLLIVSPFWAILAAIGWERSPVKPSPRLLAAIALLVVFGFKVSTLRISDEALAAREATRIYSQSGLQKLHPRVIASHPAVYVYLDLNPADTARYGGWGPRALAHPASNAIVIWDPKCGPFNADSRLIANVAGLESFGWKRVCTLDAGWVILDSGK